MITVHILEANLKMLPGKNHPSARRAINTFPSSSTGAAEVTPSGVGERGNVPYLLHSQSSAQHKDQRQTWVAEMDFRAGRTDVPCWEQPLSTLSTGTQADIAAFWGAQECSQSCTPRSHQQNPPGSPALPCHSGQGNALGTALQRAGN